MTGVIGVDGTTAIDYPESDGSLIAESDWHRDELFDLLYRLKARYAASADTYVSGHMLVYYEEGEPASVFAPDVMVAFGVPAMQRRVHKLWEERRAPTVVFEVSSRKTWLEDRGNKRALCERLGVAEYYLWDPRYEYLKPLLQGFRLVGASYRALRPEADASLVSSALGLCLRADANRLELYDLASGERLVRPGELAVEAERRARLAVEAERRARLALEAEVERLRTENARLRGARA